MNFLKQLAKQVFQYEARLILKKYNPKIIAITGSVGKTLTKELIYSVLSKKFFVRKSEKSFRTSLGAPLAIIGCSNGAGSLLKWLENIILGLKLLVYKSNYPEYLLLELDSDKPGDLKGIGKWLNPDILIITAIGEVPSHIESFITLENFLAETKEIINSVKRDGVIIYNADDSVVSNLLEKITTRKISCGVSASADVTGFEFEILYNNSKNSITVPTGMSFDILEKDLKYKINIFGSVGVHNEYACLLAYAVGKELGIDSNNLSISLNKFAGLSGRMNIISGIKDTIILDDSYNASPIAMKESIETFSKIKTSGRKIAVIGDMLELGQYSSLEHKKVAEILNGNISNIFCVGIRTRKVSDELLNLGFPESNILSFDTAKEAGLELQNLLKEGDMVFIKGSQAMRMERVVEEIMRHPEDKNNILVRQEPEWLSRE